MFRSWRLHENDAIRPWRAEDVSPGLAEVVTQGVRAQGAFAQTLMVYFGSSSTSTGDRQRLIPRPRDQPSDSARRRQNPDLGNSPSHLTLTCKTSSNDSVPSSIDQVEEAICRRLVNHGDITRTTLPVRCERKSCNSGGRGVKSRSRLQRGQSSHLTLTCKTSSNDPVPSSKGSDQSSIDSRVITLHSAETELIPPMTTATQPNIIVFFTDQQRHDTTGAAGSTLDLTPNFDRMASEGTHVANSFTCQPVCGPARACLQTGLYATQTGVWCNGCELKDGQRTLAHHFNDAGYDTGYIGKWHLYPQLHGYVPREGQGGYKTWLGANLLEFTSDAYDCHLWDQDGNEHKLPGYRVDGRRRDNRSLVRVFGIGLDPPNGMGRGSGNQPGQCRC